MSTPSERLREQMQHIDEMHYAGDFLPSISDPSQTSTPVDAVPAERAPEVSAQQGTPDLATSTPDRAVDVAGTTHTSAGGDQ